MKAIVCELCGSNQLTRQSDGTYTCDYCGTKYTLEAVRQLFAGEAVQVTAADFDIQAGSLVRYRGQDEDVRIPDGVRSIGEYAFKGLGIRSIFIPPSVVEIGRGAFMDCSNLESVALSEGLEYIAGGVFENCHRLRRLDFPSTLTRMGTCLGEHHLSLEEVRFLGKVPRACMSLQNPYSMSSGEVVKFRIGLSESLESLFEESPAFMRIYYPNEYAAMNDSKTRGE